MLEWQAPVDVRRDAHVTANEAEQQAKEQAGDYHWQMDIVHVLYKAMFRNVGGTTGEWHNQSLVPFAL